ncbi:hypothetical protein ABEF95_003905 [Exophiala dermatitidis]
MDESKEICNDRQDLESSASTVTIGRSANQGSIPRAGNEDTESSIPEGTGINPSHQEKAAENPIGEGLGVAAIGETLTIKKRVLPKGDPVPSVIDPTSSDPTTFKMPEHSSYQPVAGVPPGAAETAASRAFNKANERDQTKDTGTVKDKDIEQTVSHIPGAFPTDEHPTPIKETAGATSTGSTQATDTGSRSYGSDISPGPSAHDPSVPAPSTLTTTASPSTRDADYGQAEGTKIPDRATTSALSTNMSTANASNQPESSGTFDRILGAVGLGGAAAAISSALPGTGEEKESRSVSEYPEQPTTTTGVDSYTAPTRSGNDWNQPITTTGVDTYTSPTHSSDVSEQPGVATGAAASIGRTSSGPTPSHYRKESIQTTAYPQGQDSPAPINPPVGGTAVAADEEDRKDHDGHRGGLAAAGAGIGLAAGGVAAHEYEHVRSQPEKYGRSEPEEYGRSQQPSGSATFYSLTTSDTPSQSTQPTSSLSRGIQEDPSGFKPYREPSNISSQPYASTDSKQDSTGYSEAATTAGLGVGAGTAAAAIHDYQDSGRQTAGALPYRNAPAASQSSASSDVPFASSQHAQGLSRDIDESPTARSGFSQTPTDLRQPVGAENTDDSWGYGRTAAAAGLGAGVGAAGAHALERKDEPETGDLSGGRAYPTSQTTVEDRPMVATEQAAVPEPVPSAGGQTAREVPIAAAATHQDTWRSNEGTGSGEPVPAATSYSEPARDTTASKRTPETVQSSERSTKTEQNLKPEKEDKYTGRDAALAGAAGAGAAAYGAHEYNEHQSEQEAARAAEAKRQQDIAEQEEARRRQFEKDQKAAEKRASKEEKAEKKHAKAVEKEQKQHEKELAKEEKEEKKHQKELAKEEKMQEKEKEKAAAAVALADKERRQQYEREERERFEAEQAERKRREKEAAGAAAIGTGAAAGTAAYAAHDKEQQSGEATPRSSRDTDRNRLHKDPPQEKKPGILKRIFKRRKNKDTGLEEEYSTDEEEEPRHSSHSGRTGAAVGAGAGVGATAAAAAHEHHRNQGAATGGSVAAEEAILPQKPSYNPLHKDETIPLVSADTPTADNLASERQADQVSGTTERTATGVNEPVSSSSGTYPAGTGAGTSTGYDTGTGYGTGSTAAGTVAAAAVPGSAGHDTTARDYGTPGTTGTTTPGLHYDPKHDPEASRHLQEVEQQAHQQHHQEHHQGGFLHRVIDELKPLPKPDEIAREHGHEPAHTATTHH